ncbi:MAG: RNA degradosome polyphosphate kinase, partial [Helicobacter sp.]|nr:RNA degradosome polyphosphate kinase [Helicobacter sp.]
MNITDPQNYINRELSWLQFNTRVLREATNKHSPLLERLKFLAIYATNLDEFYMIRVAGLKRLYEARITESGADRLTPLQQLKEIRRYLHVEREELERLYFELMGELEKEGLKVRNFAQNDRKKKADFKEYFETHLYPIVIPIAVDSTHPFPH